MAGVKRYAAKEQNLIYSIFLNEYQLKTNTQNSYTTKASSVISGLDPFNSNLFIN